MRARLQRIFGVTLLTVCIGAPVLEMFDRWDHTLQDGNDTEINLVAVVLCVGVGFAAATSMIRRIRADDVSTFVETPFRAFMSSAEIPLALPIPQASPPTILRV